MRAPVRGEHGGVRHGVRMRRRRGEGREGLKGGMSPHNTSQKKQVKKINKTPRGELCNPGKKFLAVLTDQTVLRVRAAWHGSEEVRAATEHIPIPGGVDRRRPGAAGSSREQEPGPGAQLCSRVRTGEQRSA